MPRLPLPSILLPLALCACAMPQQPAAPQATGSGSSSVTSSQAASKTPQPATGSAAIVGQRLLSGGLLEYGAPGTPHTLLAVVNYGSSYARSFVREQMPRLAEDFIKPGMLKLQVLPLDLRKYPKSEQQSLYLLCAIAQGKGLAMNDALAAADAPPEGKAITALGMDLKTFQACLKSPETMRQRGEQLATARDLGVTLVPTFFLDGSEFLGLQEYPDLRGRIREWIQQ